MSYINDCINNKCQIEDIDNYIEEWHIGDSEEQLSEYLGMNEDEFFDWVRNPIYIYDIIAKYSRYKSTIEKYRNRPDLFMEELLGIKLYDYQKLALKLYDKISFRR